MKLRNLVLTLTMAALLPGFTYAGDSTDAVSASFERDLNHEFAVSYVPATVADADPLDAINVALRAGPDPVLASFERDLYREPVASKAFPDGGAADPLEAVNIVLRCENSNIFNAGIVRDLNHC
ncbi:MAG: hypothetical protein ACOY9D_00030 [Pseudomonadota bacterium]